MIHQQGKSGSAQASRKVQYWKFALISSILGSAILHGTASNATPATTLKPNLQTSQVPTTDRQVSGLAASNVEATTTESHPEPEAKLSTVAEVPAAQVPRLENSITKSLKDNANQPSSLISVTPTATGTPSTLDPSDLSTLDSQTSQVLTPSELIPSLASAQQLPVASNYSLSASDLAGQDTANYKSELIAQQPSPQEPGQEEVLRQQFRLPLPPLVQERRTLVLGGSSISSPTAFGADWGDFYAGFGFQARQRFTNDLDGAVFAGFGLGDARRFVGLEVNVSVVDLIGDTFEDGGLSFKVHRLLPEGFGVAVGVENAVRWGTTDAGRSVYGVISKVFPLQESPEKLLSRLTLSAGVGSGRFRSEDDFSNDSDSVNVFGSAGLQIARPVSFITDWTGQDLNLGLSITPFRNIPLIITPAVADVANTAGDGPRFILGVGFGFNFTSFPFFR